MPRDSTNVMWQMDLKCVPRVISVYNTPEMWRNHSPSSILFQISITFKFQLVRTDFYINLNDQKSVLVALVASLIRHPDQMANFKIFN